MNLYDVASRKKWFINNPLFTRDEVTLKHPINVLSMFYEVPNDKISINHPINRVDYFPMQKTRFYFYTKSHKRSLFDNPKVDLIYGGFPRKGKRNKFLKEYFFNLDKISSEVYGKIFKDLKDLSTNKTIVSPEVPYCDVILKNKDGLATIIPAEIGYNDNCITPRIVEALMSGLICFIQEPFDKTHKIFEEDFLYVNSGEELQDKILKLKSDSSLYDKLIKYQESVLNEFKNKDLGTELLNIINRGR